MRFQTAGFLSLVIAARAAQADEFVYRYAEPGEPKPSVIRFFTTSEHTVDGITWRVLRATKANGASFTVWTGTAGSRLAHYVLSEAGKPVREYRHALTGDPVLPAHGLWPELMPAATGPEMMFLGHRYTRQSGGSQTSIGAPPGTRQQVELRPDLLIGPASNTRQKDETRRYDGSDYELIPITRADYARLREAGVSCVAAQGEQSEWADDLGLYYWRGASSLPYPEMLYRSQYLGEALFLDEPAVVTRDHVLRPRLAREPAFRRSISPQLAFEAFREHFEKARTESPQRMERALAARPDVSLGSMRVRQQNLYTWETMADTAGWQLSRDSNAPDAFVFEPPGRVGARRTLPEMDMTYGVQIPPAAPGNLTGILYSFLRGASRATGKQWGVSIYGAVDRADAPYWLTRAYDLGATRFFFWDNYQLAAVPFPEVLALARHLSGHARQHPRPGLEKLRSAAEVLLLLPRGYGLGHVQMGKGSLWGIPELNLERTNAQGVTYRMVMANLFTEIERCLRMGVEFDTRWDLPGLPLSGYREVVRVREDGRVEVNGVVLDAPRTPERPAGGGPELRVTVTTQDGKALPVKAVAYVRESTAPVYYTLGADGAGVYHNARVAWELFGPEPEDYQYLAPPGLKPVVRVSGRQAESEMVFTLEKPGAYRLRASTVDEAGRATTVWTRLTVEAAPGGLRFRLN